MVVISSTSLCERRHLVGFGANVSSVQGRLYVMSVGLRCAGEDVRFEGVMGVAREIGRYKERKGFLVFIP